jgi:hypothetical protein
MIQTRKKKVRAENNITASNGVHVRKIKNKAESPTWDNNRRRTAHEGLHRIEDSPAVERINKIKCSPITTSARMIY